LLSALLGLIDDMQVSNARLWMGAAIVFMAALTGSSPPREPTTAQVEFDTRWHDGRAELDGYRYTITRYGQKRQGQAVMIYVTEPWSRGKRVKVEDASKNPADVFDVLKLNLVRDFQTGIYDYNTMVSLFVASHDFSPVEVTFTSAEWCGNVYAKVLFDNDTVNETLFSYFEDETGTKSIERPRDGLAQDALFILLRGLRGAFLSPGGKRAVPLLSGILESRLRHQPLQWSTAEIERSGTPVSIRVPSGNWSNAVYYEVRVQDGRTGRFWIEPDRDGRVLKWSWTESGKGEASESGELTGTLRTAYWKENGPGNERLLRQLGLSPSPSFSK
jgi:hypothetical protein